jgi:hypothetical protein
MRYIVAFVGAVVIFIGAFLISGVLIAVISPKLLYPIEFMGISTNNPIGFVLAAAAATASFRATLRRKNKPPPRP